MPDFEISVLARGKTTAFIVRNAKKNGKPFRVKNTKGKDFISSAGLSSYKVTEL